MVNNEPQKIVVDGEEIISDISNSKNVIKFDSDSVVIVYTNNGLPIRFRRWDLDNFIVEHTWRLDKGSNYPYTKVTKNIEGKITKYDLSREPFLKLIKGKQKSVKVYIHRYIMGFYDKDGRESIKKQFPNTPIADIHVHHRENPAGPRFINFSDQMDLIPKTIHGKFKAKRAYTNYYGMFPIRKIKDKDGNIKYTYELRDNNRKIYAISIDNNPYGLNVHSLRKKNIYKFIMLPFQMKILEEQSMDKKIKLFKERVELLYRYIWDLAKELEKQGKIIIEYIN